MASTAGMWLRPPSCPDTPHTLALDGLIGINSNRPGLDVPCGLPLAAVSWQLTSSPAAFPKLLCAVCLAAPRSPLQRWVALVPVRHALVEVDGAQHSRLVERPADE